MSANTVPLTYNGFVSLLAMMAVVGTTTVGGVVQGTEAYFNTLIPQAINMAELRIQRDLDLLPLTTSKTYSTAAGAGILSISVDDFVTIQTLIATINGVPTPLLPTTVPFIQSVYPNSGPQSYGPPAYFAPYGGDRATGGDVSNNFLLGPTPDNAYSVTATGTIRMPSLNEFNTAPQAGTATTFISAYLPDLMLQAAMIVVAEYQRNFGKIADDPAMAMTYEQMYQLLLAGAKSEEFRKKFAGDAWSAEPPSPVATPTRVGS